MVLGHVNRLLARHGRKLGPDPAEHRHRLRRRRDRQQLRRDALRRARRLLQHGPLDDVRARRRDRDRHRRPRRRAAFAAAAPELARGLAEIRDELRADPELSERIARKFEIKNTTGYRLCAFLDADEPLEIFRRLMIGSEGTLAFLAEAVFDTVPLGAHTSSRWRCFADIDAAAEVVHPLVEAGASATELMVAPTLIAAAWNMPGTPERWKELPPESAALLVEFRADAERAARRRPSAAALRDPAGRGAARSGRGFTARAREIEMLWHVREGMQGLLAAMRPPGVR